ncbi:MAG TPA: plastocyanin/azurin family copper-binding protein [Nitrososphaerales archaeon]|nr:plastocyanin/azurin family copper-binding protein [Nitrososphaerales archaeon]
MLLPLVLVPAYFFVATEIPHSAPPPANGALSLSPAVPMVAPGQIQNYSTLTLRVPPRSAAATTLSAVSPEGLDFQVPATPIPPGQNATVPVFISASPAIAAGTYEVSVVETQGTSTRNQTFEVKVVPALVVMQAVAFHPPVLNVTTGTTVYWINLDSTIGCCDPGYHDVSLQGGGMNVTSPILRRLDTWSYTFQAQGQFYYYCTIHPWMVGTVVVQPAA